MDLDRAAKDLGELRGREFEEAERAEQDELRRVIDQLALNQASERIASEQQQRSPSSSSNRKCSPNTLRRCFSRLEKALQNPVIRDRIDAELRQVAGQVDAAKAQLAAHANQLTAEANALMAVNFPELAGMNAGQIQGPWR